MITVDGKQIKLQIWDTAGLSKVNYQARNLSDRLPARIIGVLLVLCWSMMSLGGIPLIISQYGWRMHDSTAATTS